MGEITPVLAMDHLRFREASQRTIRAAEEPVCPGSEAGLLGVGLLGARGGNNLATHRSPWGEGVKR